MSQAIEISSDVFWVGVRHPQLRIFDELFPTQNGTTYNAYLVHGSEKSALIDTVKAPFTEEYLDNVRSIIPLEKIDLLVVNHTEPDHSGAIKKLLEINPGIKIYCTKAAANFLGQLLNTAVNTHAVSEEEEIDLGGKSLRFIVAPYLHWPDTMFTYLVQDKVLFSCDAFGAHFCGEGLYNDEAGDFSDDFALYFDTIMRPFKEKIREALAKIEALPINLICPSHGPVLRQDPMQVIASYRSWAAPPAESGRKRVLLLVHSPHGNTRSMAELVRSELEKRGLDVAQRSIVETDDGELRDEMERADALLVATPTVNRDAPPPVWHALSLLSLTARKVKIAGVFGSYGWSGEAVHLIEERLKGLKFELAAPAVRWRFSPSEEDKKACLQLAQAVAERLLGD